MTIQKLAMPNKEQQSKKKGYYLQIKKMETVDNVYFNKNKEFDNFSLSLTRLMLFYADDVTEKAHKMRS